MSASVKQSRAEEAHRSGDFAEAIRLQREVVEKCDAKGEPGVDARKLLSLYCYSAGRYEEAYEALKKLREIAPDDIESFENMGVILRLLGRREEAVEVLREVHDREPTRVNVLDALAHTYANLGDEENTQRFGRLSLELKDKEAADRTPICEVPDQAPPEFTHEGPKKNVISFSLWGKNLRYLKGAIRNAQAAIDVYPGWTVRFYCDNSVPDAVLERLREYGAEVVMRPRPASFFDGLLWRFEVVHDDSIDRFLIRDCDSVVNVKERVAVDEWLRSDRWFHVMRDFPSHTEVVLAGMWGGVSGVLPAVEEIRNAFRPTTAPTRTFDQLLLRECVWPVVRQSVLIHDSVYTECLGSVDFPEWGRLPFRFHVGQNEAAVRPDVFVPMPVAPPWGQRNAFVLTGLDYEAVEFCRALLEQISGIEVCPSPTIPDLRNSAGGFLESVSQGETEAKEPDPGAVADVVLVALRSLLPDLDDSAQVVGWEDPDGDVEFLSALAEKASVKLLCVVRDPRDTASSRRVREVEEGVELGRSWNAHLGAVAAVNQSRPGTVELVRYEDLSAEKSGQSVGRICSFLGLQPESFTIEAPGKIDSGKPLPDEIARAISDESGAFLKRLLYLGQGAGVTARITKTESDQ